MLVFTSYSGAIPATYKSTVNAGLSLITRNNFDKYKEIGLKMGFKYVESGPLGGELDEDILSEEAKSPSKPPVRLAPEFDTRAFHKIGALGAGRDDNPTKSSFLNQLYFVVGKKVTVQDLEHWRRKKGIYIDKEQRERNYLKNGGAAETHQ
ncbi:hypothetical protein FQR65_LT18006 [Abscondita terminalis]|nr:hypothetical protein FQR65_LT18006 [Abscondita terminalis]